MCVLWGKFNQATNLFTMQHWIINQCPVTQLLFPILHEIEQSLTDIILRGGMLQLDSTAVSLLHSYSCRRPHCKFHTEHSQILSTPVYRALTPLFACSGLFADIPGSFTPDAPLLINLLLLKYSLTSPSTLPRSYFGFLMNQSISHRPHTFMVN